MAVIILELFGTWSLVAVVMGLGLGALIGRGERARRDQFLSYVFATVESMQAFPPLSVSRSLPR
ncbi:MAG TPA: hypothetical protein VKT71_02595 [Candidatus Acidoferrales bacterium]|nr:hypothetical protein [Candidatus Acidoferrales bacterium]